MGVSVQSGPHLVLFGVAAMIKDQIVLLVTLPSLMVFSVSAAHLTEAEARQLQLPVQNVSLVITYTGMVVAALMFAGFLYVSLNFGRRRSGYGYNYDQDYYQDYASYSRRSPEPSALSDLLEYLHKYDEDEEGEETQTV